MGRQGGIARFLGSSRTFVGYVDDGKVLWRKHNGMNRKKWSTLPCFEGQRVAANYFGAASAVAGDLWGKLPVEMRRLSDGGAFNRLVGRCRDLVEEDGQVWNLVELAGLDLSADSSGPLAVTGSIEAGWRLGGVRELMQGIDVAVGPGAGRRSEKYVVASRHADDSITRETVDWGPLGDCRGWRAKYKDLGPRKKPVYEEITVDLSTKRRQKFKSYFVPVRQVVPPGLGYTGWGGAERRVRVWICASEIGETERHRVSGKFQLKLPSMRRTRALVTDWFVGGRFEDVEAGVPGWAADYLVDGNIELPPYHADGTGIFVIFTAVEVAEKRGRHWVRLPWCSRMQIHSVVDNWDRVELAADYSARSWVQVGGVLRALPARAVEGMGIDFLKAWEKGLCPIDNGQWIIDNGQWIIDNFGVLMRGDVVRSRPDPTGVMELAFLGRDGP
jgi:hypothetical protein